GAPVELPITIRVIDDMPDICGAQREHWHQGKEADRKGNRCMIGALMRSAGGSRHAMTEMVPLARTVWRLG
ncbi:MAG TPA: hypothetical protein VFO46_25690, partial [Candidatus Sulfotelmatobacter sp.]|nr:hypothetical protein [Candidatus Sulfotelmatobacter sp.]